MGISCTLMPEPTKVRPAGLADELVLGYGSVLLVWCVVLTCFLLQA